jgi:hypothetical protein
VLILAIYTSILGLGLLAAVWRRRMLLLQGRGVFVLTGLSATLGLALLLRKQAPAVWPAAIWVALLIAALAARPRWIFLWFDPEEFAAHVESSLQMLLIPFVRTEAGYTLHLRSGDVYMQLRAGPGRTAVLKFRQDQQHKKAGLLRSLLRKKFDPLFPRLKIHLR